MIIFDLNVKFPVMSTIHERIQDIVNKFGESKNTVIAKQLGVSEANIRGYIKGIMPKEDILEKIVRNYDVSARWLLTGEGDMMDNNEKLITTQQTKEGIPYYDVDFIGGFDEVFNDQTVNPELSITNGICPRAQLWCNITGHSMEPTISNGDIIALRQCSVDDIQYGEIYAVVMDSFRTVKMLRRSETPGMIRFVPVNTADFDPQDFPVKRILKIYEVVGCLRRFF